MPSSTHRTIAHDPDADDEAALVARAVNGEGAAFEVIMRRHNQLLFRTARSIVRNDTEAEDVLQEAYLHAWRGLRAYRAESRLATWLVRIVTNEALGRLRRKHLNLVPLDAAMHSPEPHVQAALTDAPHRGPEYAVLRAQARHLMESRIDQLPEAFRTVFVLRAIEELSVEEVAQSLGIAEATVRTRHFRARSQLREWLAQDMDVALGDVFAFDGARCERIVAAVLASGGSVWSAPDGPAPAV
ncbi:MAG: RNA polymerase sigma factor [Gemmatimonadaceae bacterium]|nr:RNA polymerase sigma factor [Gemmatimonadaceae bacterium]